jgi:hypothetical protein
MKGNAMSIIEIRRMFTQVEDIFHEFGPAPDQPLRRGAIGAVLRNPYAGRYEANILPMMEELNPVGVQMAKNLLQAMAVPIERIEGYGKGVLIGEAGELEHGALWHASGGYAMRQVLGSTGSRSAYVKGQASVTKGQSGNALAIVPSTKKVAAPSATLDVPLNHINASYVRSHLDAFEVRIPGAPRANEIVMILVMSTGPRIHARVAGLKASEISQWDGQR